MTEPDERPDVEIGASFKAKRLRFKKVPETEVEFDEESEVRLDDIGPEVETASGSKRENLPEKVEPNVTYRDVHVRWGAAAKLRDDQS